MSDEYVIWNAALPSLSSAVSRQCRVNSMRSIGDGNAPVNYRYNPFTAKAPARNVAPRSRVG
jgi:hypothetical protein